MEQFVSFDALLIPVDDRAPHIVQLMTTPGSYSNPYSPQSGRDEGRVPHPEIHMEFIAENVPGAWAFQYATALEGFRSNFTQPYMIFFPVISRDGMAFSYNKTIRDMQGGKFREDRAWRGNIVVAKYRDTDYKHMMNITMADYAVIKNYLSTHGCRWDAVAGSFYL